MPAVEAGDVVWRIGADMSDLDRGLAQAQQNVGHVFDKISVNAGIAMTAVGAAITVAFESAVSSAVDFGTSMAEINTLGVQDLAALEDAVKNVSSEFGLNLTDAAKAAYDAISSGASEAQTPELLAKAAKAATAGVSDLTTAIKLGTSVTNAFGGSLDDVNTVFDQAFIAAKLGVTTFEELSSSLGKVAPIMSAAGLSTDEMFASVGALTLGGLETSEAVTGLKSALSNIIKPTSEAKALAQQLGIEFNATALSSKGLKAFLDEVAAACGGNIEMMGTFFGSVEGLGSVLALTGEQGDMFGTMLDEMKNGVGATDEAFKKFTERDPGFALRQLKADFAILSVEIGTALLPALEKLTPIIAGILESVTKWVVENPKLAEGLTVAAAAIGGLMLALGPLLIALPGIVAGIGLFGGTAGGAAGVAGFGGLTAAVIAFGAAFGPILIAVGAGVWTFAAITFAMGETQAAQAQLAESSKRLSQAEVEINDKLRERGVILDNAIMQQLTYEQRLAYRAQQEGMQADIILRGWLAHYLGRTATEEEFARARNVSLNENVTAQEAAMAAIGESAERHSRALMTANKAETEALLAGYGIRKEVQLDGAVELTEAEMTAATKIQNAWAQANNQIAISTTAKAMHVQSTWQQVLDFISRGIQWLTDALGRVAQSMGMVGGVGPWQGVGMATGGTVEQAGWALVGERGPELVNLPAGSTVYDAQQTAQARGGAQAGGGTRDVSITVNVSGHFDLDSPNAIQQIGRAIAEDTSTRLRAAGAFG